MSPPSSKVWTNFRKKDSKIAICKLCLREVKYSGNTNNLAKHMLKNHKKDTEKPTKEKASRPDPDDPVPSCSGVKTELENKEPDLTSPSPITEAFNKASAYAVGGFRHAKISNTILYFICKDNRPFAVTEGEGFRRLINELAPTFKVPSVKYLKEKLVMKYEAIAKKMIDKLGKTEHICLSSDVWTETMAEKSYLGITAHFLEETSIVSVDLSCKELDSKHTAEYLSQEIGKVLADFVIDKHKIISIVTDNGANIVAAAQIVLPNKQIPCFAHTLNLVTNAALSLPCIKGSISKVREIVKFIKNSVNNSDKLRKIQLDTNIPDGQVKKVVLDVKTRWNSTFYMVKRFLELLPVISQILITDNTSPDMLTATEINEIRHLEKLLEPFEFATREISGEKYVTISKIIPMVNCLTKHLINFEATTESMKTLKKSLEAEIFKRFGFSEQHSKLALSTLLDPRFKNIHFQNPAACGNAISKLRAACSLNYSSASGDSEEEKVASPTFDFWQTHKELAHGKNKKGSSTDHSELTLYLSNPVSHLKSNPLETWEDMKTVFPSLYKQARKYLVLMATSVPSERLFSKTGFIMNQQRNRLSPKYLDKLVFLSSVNEREWFD